MQKEITVTAQNVRQLSDEVLIRDLQKMRGVERKATADILHYLCEVQRRRLFALYGYSGMYPFCIKFLGYTEAEAQRRIEAMKAMREMPEIEEKIREGTLSLTAVAQAQSFFNAQRREDKTLSIEAKKEVIQTLENKSTRECELELVKRLPDKPLPRESKKTVSETYTQVTVNYPNHVLKNLERIKALLSHKNPNLSHTELINEMSEIVLDKIDPLRKPVKTQRDASVPQMTASEDTKRELSQPSDETKCEQSQPSSVASGNGRKTSRSHHVRVTDQRVLHHQAKGKCTYISPVTGEICGSEFNLEIDHVTPRARGGNSEVSNLRLYCKAHNQRAAIEAFGLQQMDRFINKRQP